MATPKILLQGGLLLIHDDQYKVQPTRADLLIEDSMIAEIGENLHVSPGTRVVDCKGKIISPGFIDTHRHLWQTQLKGSQADNTLLRYFSTGNFSNALYSPSDFFWGQLSGCLESIDAGTTTVVDHASVNYSPLHTKNALRATIASGIRSIFCYCPTPSVATWKPEFTLNPDLLPAWVMSNFDHLISFNGFGTKGRVVLGFAFDGLWLPGNILKPLFAKVRAAGAKLITCHASRASMFDQSAPTQAATLASYDLLGPDVLLSHYNNISPDDVRLLRESGTHISTTPSTELQMAMSHPTCLHPDLYAQASLGVDCHSACSASIPAQMMLILQHARAKRHEDLEAQGKWSDTIKPSVEEVFNLGTILGARAIGMESEIGSLKKGKKADIVVFGSTSPAMLGAAERHPVNAIVLHSSPRDVEMVIIDGAIRKEGSVLADSHAQKDVHPESEVNSERQRISWQDVVRNVTKSSEDIEVRRAKTVDRDVAEAGILKGFYMNEERLVRG